MITPLPYYAVAGRLSVEVHPSRAAMTRSAARAAAAYLQGVIGARGEARAIFSTETPQDEFLAALINPAQTGIRIDWQRVTVLQLDEFVGGDGSVPVSRRHLLQRNLLDHVAVAAFHALASEEREMEATCGRHAAALAQKPVDLICLGIGDSGQLAGNDAQAADFDELQRVKRAALDEGWRRRQVEEGRFALQDAVPRHVLSLTVPAIREARRISVHVAGPKHATAVRAVLREPVSTACPASILRQHPNATLYLDTAAADLAFALPPGS
jgi:glucosamine-6-phosphate deaminase